ncbi:MAG: hypothetical protein AAFN10_11865 [Bacteroidota bacterium]
MRRGIIIGLFLAPWLWAMAQEEQIKYEREERVRVNIVPALAGEFVEGCGFTERLKWYCEYSQDGISYEAKVKREGIKYSIEFDEEGQLQDVELSTKWESIPQSTQMQIAQYLDSTFQNHRIKKIQKQWTGPAPDLQKLIRQEDSATNYSTQYEFVLRGKVKGKTYWYEILFNEEGLLLRRSIFVPRNTDNLDY